MTGIIDVTVRIYLEMDVSKDEIDSMVSNMEYGFEHALIADTEIIDYDIVEIK